jgi:ribonuclease HII
MLTPSLELDILNSTDYIRVVGIDEVGRGCLAGPVAVGAYIFTKDTETALGVDDSKKVSAKKRPSISQSLSSFSTYDVLYADNVEIDSLGIAKAIEKLVAELVLKYDDMGTVFLIDGRFKRDFGPNTRQVIHGDATYYSIAAASIVAKVERDSLMDELDSKYVGYGFCRHKGYGTREHLRALEMLGLCPVHRLSYMPVKKYVSYS